MNLTNFNAQQYRNDIVTVLHDLSLSLQAGTTHEDKRSLKMLDALQQAIDIMHRADISDSSHALSPDEATEIADYVLNLLDELAIAAGGRGLQQTMLDLHKLSLPVTRWVKAHAAVIKKLDIIVNAIATHANTITAPHELEQFCNLVKDVLDCVDDKIKHETDNPDPMRPWRILNLNWGIIATRSHNTTIMRDVFDQLVINIPQDAPRFFEEGMQQMAIINYPQSVRDVMASYYQQWSRRERRH